jgi:hypothetical protein
MARTKSKAATSDAEEQRSGEEERELLDAILRRLNGLTFLLAQEMSRGRDETAIELDEAERKPTRKQPPGRQEQLSVLLTQAGLRPIEIARLTGRHPNNISRDISKARKDGRLPPLENE